MTLRALPLLLLLPACDPQMQAYNGAPEERAKFVVDTFYAADDAALPFRSWLPDPKKFGPKPRAVIVALHGFNDYSKAFISTGTFFQKRNVAVYAYDQRGFGQAPLTGFWANQDNLLNDLKQFVLRVHDKYPRTPIYILGESMGGAEAIYAVSQPGFPKVQGIILVAPAVWGEETMPLFYRSTLWLAAHTIPFKELTGSDLKILASNNYPMLRRLVADPLVIKRTRIDAIYGMVQLMDRGYHDIPDVRTPTLLLYGACDQVIPRQPIENALERFTIPIQFVYYPDGFHMLTRDIQGERVMEDIQSWLQNPEKPVPSGYGQKLEPGSNITLRAPNS